MSHEAPSLSPEEKLAAMSRDELEAMLRDLVDQKDQKEQELAAGDTTRDELERELTDLRGKIHDAMDVFARLEQRRDDLAEKIRAKRAAAAAARAGAGTCAGSGTGPGAGPGGSTTGAGASRTPEEEMEDLFNEMKREHEAGEAAGPTVTGTGEAPRSTAETGAAATDSGYIWGPEHEEPIDPKAWNRTRTIFENTFGLFFDKFLGAGNKEGALGKLGRWVQTHSWMKAGLNLCVKVPAKVFGAAIFTTTPVEYFFQKGMVAEEQEMVKEAVENCRRIIKERATHGEATMADPDIAAAMANVHQKIDSLEYIATPESRTVFKERVALLMKDYLQSKDWAAERYGKEDARIFNEYIVTKIQREEILADALSAGMIGLNYLLYRGISSAGLAFAARHSKENHNFERTHWKEKRSIQTREQRDDYNLLRAKETTVAQVAKKGGYEWMDNQFISSLGQAKFYWDKESNFWPFSAKFWNAERVKFVQGSAMTLRGIGVVAAMIHATEANAILPKNLDHLTPLWKAFKHGYEENSGIAAPVEGAREVASSVAHNYWINWNNVWTGLRKVRDFVFGGSDQAQASTTPTAPMARPPAPPVIDHSFEPPKMRFDLRDLHELRDLGYVNKSSEPFVLDKVHMMEVQGIKLEFRVKETIDELSGQHWKTPQLISINNRNVEAIDIISKKQFYEILNDPDHLAYPSVEPLKNVQFTYWTETTTDGNVLHRAWERDDISYELKATSVYQDMVNKQFYTLPEGQTVHHQNDELQNFAEYRIVGVRMPDGTYRHVDVAINDPLHGHKDPNAGFSKFHQDFVSGKFTLKSIAVPEPAPTPEPVARVTPEPQPKAPPPPAKAVVPPPPAPAPKPTVTEKDFEDPAPAAPAKPPKPPVAAPPEPVKAPEPPPQQPPKPVEPPPAPPVKQIHEPVAPAKPADPVRFPSGGAGRDQAPIKTSMIEGRADSYTSHQLHRVVGRTGVGPATGRDMPPDAANLTTPDGRDIDPNSPIGNDIRSAIQAAEHAQDESLGTYEASSPGRIVQKIFNQDFLVRHDIKMSELANLKANMRLLLEGKSIRSTDELAGITQKEFHDAMAVDHIKGHWLVDIKDEQQWNSLINKLIHRADYHLGLVSGHEDLPHPGPAGQSSEDIPARPITTADTSTGIPEPTAPGNLPVVSTDEAPHQSLVDAEAVSAPDQTQHIRDIFKNSGLTSNERFREISKAIEQLERGRHTISLPHGEHIVINKLGTGPGAFIRLPDEEESRFWSPKTAKAIEKLFRRKE